MNRNKVNRAAEMLAAAWRDRRQVADFPDDCRPTNRAEAYAVQDEMIRRLGLTGAGWKIGMGSAAGLRRFALDGPVPGRLLSETFFENPATISAASCVGAMVEPEFAVRLGADLARRAEAYSRDEVTAAIAAVHLAIEVAGYRVAPPEINPLYMIADNGANAAFVVGPEIAGWPGVDLIGAPVELWIDGALAAPGFEGEDRVDPIGILLWTANDLSERGIGFHAGEFLSTGTATAPMPIAAGSEAVACFEGLGEVRVRFTDEDE